MSRRIYDIFMESPKEALEETFRRAKENGYRQGCAFMYQSTMGIHSRHRYGSFRIVTKQELSRRTYDIEYWDGAICIFWTDVVHDPKRGNIPKEVAWALVPL